MGLSGNALSPHPRPSAVADRKGRESRSSLARLVGEARICTAWNEYLKRFPRDSVDVYFQEEYVRLYEYQGYSAACFLYEEGESVFAFPFLRLLHDSGKEACDIATAYGYGGPISSRQDKAFYARGWQAMRNTLAASGARRVYVRFHPVLGNHGLVPKSVRLRRSRTTIAVGLASSVEDIWRRQPDSAKRGIRKAEREGLEFFVDHEFEHLDDFVEIYVETMHRVGANSIYLFNDRYFRRFPETLADKSTLCMVAKGGEVIAGALLLSSGPYAHLHLTGSRGDCLRLRPNNLLYYRIALESRDRGAQLLHLGGGIGESADDRLLAFKRQFGGLSYDYFTTEFALA